MNQMTLTTADERQILVTRRFAAAPALIYQAHTEPALVQRWMLGPDGWSMPVCVCDAHPGGRLRFEWSNGHGREFYLTGEFLELEPPFRIVHVERMHLPESTPDNLIETRFAAAGAGTAMTMRMTLPDAEARTRMLGTGMAHGMEASYRRLEGLLATGTPLRA
jgi:uncharacterized protein YndB with AHSA1/START domain